ncbi:MAG TPA: DUF2807 domain-containing protein [Candidatus Paceibacterota bacterium]|nr:DUF2807 domain-containing protein [Candidatus Paceibacterota bacterium]
MKKTIPITLAKILFYVEEDAYIRLSDYLDTIKLHFSTYPDNVEIITDIENRIAEQFLENQNKNNIVTIEDVEKLIISMGNVEDFNEPDTPTDISIKKKTGQQKKLFRNPDDMLIAGVASGLGAYLGIDTSLIRILFVLTLFIGGAGIAIYIILWIIVPEAKTSTEKLQMRGEPVTLESVSELLKEKANEVKKNSGTIRKTINSFFGILSQIIKGLFNFLTKIIGLGLTVSFGFGIFILLFVFAAIIFNVQSPYIDFPFMEIGHKFLFYIGAIATFFSLLIPAIFILLLGVKIFNKRKTFGPAVVFSLLGIWCLALITMGVVGLKVIPEYKNIIESSQKYENISVDFPLTNFKEIEIRNGNKVSIIQGDVFKVTVDGRERDIENLSLEVDNNILKVGTKDDFKICIFCFYRTPDINVTMPKLDRVYATNSSSVTTDEINSDNLFVKLSNSSRANIIIKAKNLEVEESNSSHSYISGNVGTATFNLSNSSRVLAQDLITKNTTIKATNSSRAEVHGGDTLNVNLHNSSVVYYTGNPKIEQNLLNSSRIEKQD